MRVTFSTMPDTLVRQLSSLSSQQARLNSEVASGKRVTQLGDDPTAMSQTLNLQAENSQTAQYRKNIAALQSRATSSYSAVQGLQKIASRLGEITTLAGDGTKSQAQLDTYANEVQQLLQQAVSLANSQAGGQYLFGGTQTGQAPFVTTKDAQGNITGVTYQGGTEVAAAEIAPRVTVSAQLPGANASGSGATGLVSDSRTGADLFSHLIQLEADLRAGDHAAISGADTAAIGKDEDHLTIQMSVNGLLQSQLSTADTLAASRTLATTQRIADASDTDLTETLTQLTSVQTAFEAAIQSGASLLRQDSLLDYLR